MTMLLIMKPDGRGGASPQIVHDDFLKVDERRAQEDGRIKVYTVPARIAPLFSEGLLKIEEVAQIVINGGGNG